MHMSAIVYSEVVNVFIIVYMEREGGGGERERNIYKEREKRKTCIKCMYICMLLCMYVGICMYPF